MRKQMTKQIALFLMILFIGQFVCGCNNHKNNQEMAVEKWKAARNNIALDLAGKQMENGQTEQAISTIQETLSETPELVEGWILLSQLYQQKDMPSKAENCLEEALRINPRHPEANYQMAIVKEITATPDEALAHYQTAIEVMPDNLEYILAKVQILATMGQDQQAIDIIQKQLNLGRNSTEMYLTAGNLYLKTGMYPQAVSMFKDALKKSPDNQLAGDKLYTTLLKSERYAEAEEVIKSIMVSQNRSSDPQLELALGDCYLNTGQYIMAQRSYETLIRDKGSKDEYLLRLAQVTLSRGDLDRAEVSCSRVLQNTPDNTEAALLLATIYLMKNNYQRTSEISRDILAKEQDNQLAWCLLGRALTSQGEIEQAEECYKKAQALSPDSKLTEQLLKEIEQIRLSQQLHKEKPIQR